MIVAAEADQSATEEGAESSFQIGERFSQFCDKVRIVTTKEIYKEISASFNRYQ